MDCRVTLLLAMTVRARSLAMTGVVIASGSDAIQLVIGVGLRGLGGWLGREMAGISWIASRSFAMTVGDTFVRDGGYC